jgi:uncharacterized protein YoxC
MEGRKEDISPSRSYTANFDTLVREPNHLSKSQNDPIEEVDLSNYTELLLEKEKEIKEISILKLKKLESVLRNRDVQIKDLEQQVDALNKQVLDAENSKRRSDEKLKDYQHKFNEVNQLFNEVS